MTRHAAAIVFVLTLCANAADIFIAPDGDDKNPGTSEKPLRTLDAARTAHRILRLDTNAVPATVWLRGGTYALATTFKLGPEDSGSVYRAVEGQEVRITGGKELPASAFKPVTEETVLSGIDENARGKVLQCDLRAEGVTNFGELVSRGFGRNTRVSALELFFKDKPMTLARWPNHDWAIIANAEGKNASHFEYSGERPKRWSQADDIWVHGYWAYDWADSYEKVTAIDVEKHRISTAAAGVMGYTKGKRFYALNLLEELDEPGEWYLERKTGIMYFWPPEPLDSGRIMVSILDKPLLDLDNSSNVTIRGVIFEGGRADGLRIKDGSNNLIAGCTLRNFGNTAISVSGKNNGVAGCDIYAVDGGINLGGGDRKTLTPGGDFAVNNHIHDYNRWCMVYHPAIHLGNCGNRAANNLIHDAPHNGILLSGNDHTVELNEIHHVCNETGDAGAFYMGRDWSMRGNIVRYNYFHHLEGVKGQKGFVDVMGIYLDDVASGTLAFGNIFYKVRRAIMVGGGRDNIVENNVFIDCRIAVHVDARGIGWASKQAALDGGDWGMKKKLEDVRWNQPPYSEKYPKLATMLSEEPLFPKGTGVIRNIASGCKFLELQDKLNDKKITIRDNFTEGDPGFVDAAKQNFQLKDDAPAMKTGFQRIPIEKIGLYKDEYRKELP